MINLSKQRYDSNLQPLGRESPSITTRPGLPPKVSERFDEL